MKPDHQVRCGPNNVPSRVGKQPHALLQSQNPANLGSKRLLTNRRQRRVTTSKQILQEMFATNVRRVEKSMLVTGVNDETEKLDIDILIRFAIRSIRHTTGADMVTVFAWHVHANRLRPRCSTDPCRWMRCGYDCRDEAVYECFCKGESINIANVRYWCKSHDYDIPRVDQYTDYFSKTMLCVPIVLPATHSQSKRRHGRACLGVLQLTNRLHARAPRTEKKLTQQSLVRSESLARDVRSFTGDDLKKAQSLATQLAKLIRAHGQTAEHRKHLELNPSRLSEAICSESSLEDHKDDNALPLEGYAQCAILILRRVWTPMPMNCQHQGAFTSVTTAKSTSKRWRLSAVDLLCYRLEALEFHLNLFAGAARALAAMNGTKVLKYARTGEGYAHLRSIEVDGTSNDQLKKASDDAVLSNATHKDSPQWGRRETRTKTDRGSTRNGPESPALKGTRIGPKHANKNLVTVKVKPPTFAWFDTYPVDNRHSLTFTGSTSPVRPLQPEPDIVDAPIMPPGFHYMPMLRRPATSGAFDGTRLIADSKIVLGRAVTPGDPIQRTRQCVTRQSPHQAGPPHPLREPGELERSACHDLQTPSSCVLLPAFCAAEKPCWGSWRSTSPLANRRRWLHADVFALIPVRQLSSYRPACQVASQILESEVSMLTG